MKTSKFLVLLVAFCAIMLCGCDANKGKVKELANQFVAVYNDGDKAAVYDLLPAAKTCENLLISGSIGQADGINVEKDDSTGNYIATINELKQQRLVFTVDSVGGIQMIDTYGVFRLDSISNEIALKAGVPVKKLSDIEIGKLMDSEGDFISDLKQNKQTNFLWANYGGYSWIRNYSGVNVTMSFTVSNSSSQTVSGKDYYIVVSPSAESTGRAFPTKTIDGVDIAPNEEREFTVNEPSLYNYAKERDLSYTVDIKYRSESILSFLLNYGTFSGDEYDDYQKSLQKSETAVSGDKLTLNLKGQLGGSSDAVFTYDGMTDEGEVTFTVSGQNNVRKLKMGSYDKTTDKLVMKEYFTKGDYVGDFDGTWKDGVYQGIFTNTKGGKIDFKLVEK